LSIGVSCGDWSLGWLLNNRGFEWWGSAGGLSS